MKALLFFAILGCINIVNAQVGIGTSAPNTSAALDVNSTNKGILLPRLSDTSQVSNPSAGLMIYNFQTNTPAFYNGTKWNTIATQSAAPPPTEDSISYTITGATSGFANGTFNITALSNGLQNSGSSVSFQEVSILKQLDINTIAFTKAVATGSPQNNMVIEFKVFKPGANMPYYSIKLTTPMITSFNVSVSNSDFIVLENINIAPRIFGYKDWANNISFAWDVILNSAVPY